MLPCSSTPDDVRCCCCCFSMGCAAEDYTYALERDKKPSRTHRSSRSNKLISLREGLLSKSAASTGDAAGGAAAAATAANELNSLTLSTATSSDMGSVLNAHDDGEWGQLAGWL